MAKERGAAPVARIEGAGAPSGSPAAPAEHGSAPFAAGRAAKAVEPATAPAAAPGERPSATAPAGDGAPAPSGPVANGGPRPGASAGGDATSSAAAPGVLERICTWFAETFPNSRHAVLGGLAGLVVAIMLFTIGILKTLVILVLVVVGVACGQYLDGDPKIIRMVQSLAKRR